MKADITEAGSTAAPPAGMVAAVERAADEAWARFWEALTNRRTPEGVMRARMFEWLALSSDEIRIKRGVHPLAIDPDEDKRLLWREGTNHRNKYPYTYYTMRDARQQRPEAD